MQVVKGSRDPSSVTLRVPPSPARGEGTSIPQQFVHARLRPRLRIHPLDDHRAVERRTPIRIRQRSRHHHRISRNLSTEDLAGAAIDQALQDGGDLTTEQVGAAVAALDENSVEVAALVGSAYPDAEQPFLDSWRSHIPFFVNYTVAKATGDQAGVDQAVADLNGYAVSFGQLINSVVPELPAEAVQAELEMHAVSLLAAIDANIANDPAYFDLLKEAASHMPMTATALAGGIATNLGIQ